MRSLTAGSRLICVVLEGISSLSRGHQVAPATEQRHQEGADPLMAWQRLFSGLALVGVTVEWIIRGSMTESAKEVMAVSCPSLTTSRCP